MRYTRQERLAEVGEAGQARLRASEVAVRGEGVAGSVEATYLAAAGVGALRVRDAEAETAARAMDATVRVHREPATVEGSSSSPSLAPLEALRLDPAAHDVAMGAWRALAALRDVLGVKKPGTP